MRVSYGFAEAGYTTHGEKIPEVPIVSLVLRVDRLQARGPAIVDTGFDGGVYANIEIVKLFADTKPSMISEFDIPVYGKCEFEVFTAQAFLRYKGKDFEIGEARVYVPTEPEHLTGEVLVGREILNRFNELLLNPKQRILTIEL